MRLIHRIKTKCAANRFRRGRLISVVLAPLLFLSLSDHPAAPWGGAAAAATPTCVAGHRVAAREMDRLLWWHFAEAGWSAPWHLAAAQSRGTGNDC